MQQLLTLLLIVSTVLKNVTTVLYICKETQSIQYSTDEYIKDRIRAEDVSLRKPTRASEAHLAVSYSAADTFLVTPQGGNDACSFHF